jgi:hypothetical protein
MQKNIYRIGYSSKVMLIQLGILGVQTVLLRHHRREIVSDRHIRVMITARILPATVAVVSADLGRPVREGMHHRAVAIAPHTTGVLVLAELVEGRRPVHGIGIGSGRVEERDRPRR